MTSPSEPEVKVITLYLAGGQSITVPINADEVGHVMDKVSAAWAGGEATEAGVEDVGPDEMWVGDGHMIRASAVTGLRFRDWDAKTSPTDFAEGAGCSLRCWTTSPWGSRTSAWHWARSRK